MAMSGTRVEQALGGPRAAAISDHVVKVVSEYTGRGPTKARCFITDSMVVVLMEDTLSKGERSLATDGNGDMVMSMRKAFQHTMRPAFVAGIERILDRKVVAFMSDNHLEPDYGVEVFVLAPTTNGYAPRIDDQPG